MTKEITEKKGLEKLLIECRGIVDYWTKLPSDRTTKDRISGAVFTMLNMIIDGQVTNDELHDLFYKKEPPANLPPKPVLNPCPFCGSHDVECEAIGKGACVICRNCDACGSEVEELDYPASAEFVAIKRWNSRAIIKQLETEL
jgi:hypothetical protein